MLNKTQLKKTLLPSIPNGLPIKGKIYALVKDADAALLRSSHADGVAPTHEDTVYLVEIIPTENGVTLVPEGLFDTNSFVLP
jgi:hypothetical protein